MPHATAPGLAPSALALGLAILLGGLIGLERELHGHPAGLRTHILVCLGSTLLTLTSITISAQMGGDPARIAAQIVAGIGFLGAGAILRDRASVKGLTTAASIWTTAAIGIAIGAGKSAVSLAVITALAALFTLWALHAADLWLDRRRGVPLRLEAMLGPEEGAVASLLATMQARGATVEDVRADRAEDGTQRSVRLSLRLPAGQAMGELAEALTALDCVRSVRIQ